MSKIVNLEGKPVTSETAEKAKQLPDPTGYRLLCAIPEVDKTFEGSGLLKADLTIHNEELLATVLFVLKVGPDAYKDEKRFPSGPWAKTGDFVVVRPHAGTRIRVHNQELRIINDDSVECVVQDPRGIRRA